jgi:pimeloyl-ACP methyl ester carboxylesterase
MSNGPEWQHSLPYDAEFVPSTKRRFHETIVFVHNFGGGKKSVARHLRFVNDLGFDAVRFDLVFNGFKFHGLPINKKREFGVRHLWSEEIEAVLNAIPGRKIVYSFSMPSLGSLQAIGWRDAKGVSAWVCDGGPFLEIVRCSWNLFAHEYGFKNKAALAFLSVFALAWFGFRGTRRDLAQAFNKIPAGFPVLSIRGGKDPLVRESAIDEVFSYGRDLGLHKLVLPEGGHIDGLKKFPKEYIEEVSAFLTKVAQPLS